MNNKKNRNAVKITVFYDGGCGLCSKEISYYERIAPEGVFEWVNIVENQEIFKALGYELQDGLKALHVLGSDNTIHIGVDAFIKIWSELKVWRLLALIVSLPIIKHIAEFSYKHFANWRFKKLGYQ